MGAANELASCKVLACGAYHIIKAYYTAANELTFARGGAACSEYMRKHALSFNP